MVINKIISDMLPSLWPLVSFVSLVAIVLRVTYLMKGKRKLVLHKELTSLVFIIYILCLYYILMGDTNKVSGVNLIPFKEMFRYSFTSYKFFKNIIGNILIFIPFGFFTSYYLNNKKISVPLIVTLLVSLGVEGMQYYLGRVFDIDDIILNVIGGFCGFLLYIALTAIGSKLPKFMKSDVFINLIIIIIVVLVVLFSFNINIFSYF